MINVNQITSQLARMPDQALQQYAQMHKNDPYTVSLALAEYNRRKEMRAGAQGQQGMAQQPKVVDQDIAAMAAPMPEDVGIGALPAPNMQGMAEGGIVAFGGVGPSLVQDMSPEAINERYRQGELQKIKDFFGFTGARRGYQSGFTPEEKQAGMEAPVVPPPISDTLYPDEGARGFKPPAPLTQQAPPPQPDLTRSVGDSTGTPRVPTSAGSPRAPAALTPTDFAAQFRATLAASKEPDPYAIETTALGKEMVAAKEEGLAGIKARQAASADIFKGKEANIASRSAENLRQADTNTGLAWLSAGLAIMSTPGSLATAIGKGARVGTEQFAAGLDKINAAKEKIAEAKDRLEDLKINRAEMSAKEIQDAETAIRETKITARGLGLQGLKDAGARNDKVAGHIFDATTKEGLDREKMRSEELRTKMLTDATRAAAATTAKATAGRLDLAEQRLQLGALQTRQKEAMADLKAIPNLKSKAVERATAQKKLDDINAELKVLGGATIAEPSAAAPPGGNRPALGSFQR
jgi:hypothetical protein